MRNEKRRGRVLPLRIPERDGDDGEREHGVAAQPLVPPILWDDEPRDRCADAGREQCLLDKLLAVAEEWQVEGAVLEPRAQLAEHGADVESRHQLARALTDVGAVL